MLLAFLTVVLVARPLVGGEDPGQTSDFTDPSSLSLLLIALIAGAAWAGWRLYAGRPAIHLGPVDYALVALCLVVASGVGHASYRRSAILAGSEWLGLGLLLVLVRQLAVGPQEKQALLCVLLASAVALAGHGAYQAARDLPREAAAAREAGGAERHVRDDANRRGVNPSALELMQRTERLERRLVHGPFLHPGSLAGVLVVCLPGLIVAALASARGGGPVWQTTLLAAFALLAGVILVLTGQRAALCAVLAVGAGAVCLVVPGRATTRLRLAAAACVAAGMVAAVAATGLLAGPMEQAREVWPAAWRLFEDHFWLGLGPAQFALFYPRYMAETAGPRVTEPGNLLLEIGASGGVLALAAAAVALGLFIRAVLRWRAAGAAPPAPPAPPPPGATEAGAPVEAPVRWEFYLGGMIGLVLAFSFRAGALPAEEVLGEALRLGVYAVVWFGAFSLFEGVGWTEGEFVTGLCGGAAALALYLCAENGVGYPSVAAFLWVAVGLTLAVVAPAPAAWLSRQQLTAFLPVPAFLAVAFGFYAFVCYPAVNSATTLHEVQMAGGMFARDATAKREERAIKDLPDYLRKRIIAPLERAQKEDPDNLRLMAELSAWHGQLWALAPDDDRRTNPSYRAVAWATLAQKASPESLIGYRAEFDARVRIASVLNQAIAALRKDVKEPKRTASARLERTALIQRMQDARLKQYVGAATALRAYLPRDPTNPELHQGLAGVLHEMGSPAAREEAAEAVRLDDRVGPPRKLSDRQRKQVEDWLGKKSAR